VADLSKLLDFEGGPYELSPLDVIIIGTVVLPLAEMPEVSHSLKLDKKNAGGKDGAALVGRGYVKEPVRIRLRLYKDRRRKDSESDDYIDYLTIYYRDVHAKLMPDDPKKRDALSIYHPLLAAENVKSLVFTKRGSPKHEGRGIFTVELEGEDPAKFKKSGDATSKPKGDKELISKAKGNAATTNANQPKPSTAQKGRP
jgi:hypothetical protein